MVRLMQFGIAMEKSLVKRGLRLCWIKREIYDVRVPFTMRLAEISGLCNCVEIYCAHLCFNDLCAYVCECGINLNH